MSKEPEETRDASNDKDGKSSKLAVKTETFKKLSDSELDKVTGGMRPSGRATTNPTGSDGCCGSN